MFCIKTLFLLITIFSISLSDPFVTRVNELQLPSGGFRDVTSEAPSLEATAQALFLVSFYGLKVQINADDALQFVQGLQNDQGFSASTGSVADLESTRYALYSFLHLGKEVPQAEKIGEFVRSLSDSNGLFAPRQGDSSDIKSTVAAVEILDILGQLGRTDVQNVLSKLKSYIAERIVEDGESKHFVFDQESKNEIAENYYGVYLAKKVGLELTEPKKFASYVVTFQNFDKSSNGFGGFFTSSARNLVTPESSAHAAITLHLLGGSIPEVERYLIHYALRTKTSLKESTFSHLSIAHTAAFRKSYAPIIRYHVDGERTVVDQIMEGLVVTPIIKVPMLDGLVSNGAFKIQVKSSDGWESDLVFDVNSLIYVSKKEYDSSNKLGDVKFTYKFRSFVYPLGEIAFPVEDDKRVGYGVTLEERATFGGRNLDSGEKVIPGTEFEFGLTFETRSNPSFFSGDFTLDFKVVDSSGVVHHTSTQEGSQTTRPISLSYTLTGTDFTSGDVSFVFEVRNSKGVHTVHKTVYFLEQQMVASNIEYEKSRVRLGDSLTVSMQPASLKDLHTIEPFSAAHASKRSFFMDLSSPEGKVYLSVPSENDGSSKYTFKTQVPATLDFAGVSVISFRFVSSSSESVKLQAFDVSSNELFEDPSTLQFNVVTELHLSNVKEQPSTVEFTYGTQIPFKFQIQDVLSGSFVSIGEKSKVELVLRSGEGSSQFTSVRKEIGTIKGFYEAVLEIDVNTVQGAGVIAIVASNPDGQDLPIYVEGQKIAVGYRVNIGGEIKIDSNTYSTSSNDAPKTAFVVTFSISCNGKSLDNARLVGSVFTQNGAQSSPVVLYGKELVKVPVASGSSSVYSFSFTLPHDKAASGNYKIDFLREVDLVRAQATKESEVKPLLSVSVSHKQVSESGLWVRMEFLLVLGLLASLVFVSNQKKLFHQKSA